MKKNNFTVSSPVTGSKNTIFMGKIDSEYITKIYESQFSIDISSYIQGLSDINIYKCLDTGYMFYYPFGLEGNDEFYQKLQKFPWYYLDWKWEFDLALDFIKNSDRVLEIGCGRSAFMQRLAKRKIDCLGLEMNSEAVQFGLKRGLQILNQSVEYHVEEFSNYYDVVCSFQVLEHIEKVKPFIESAICCLKNDGKLILSIPNNNSFIKYDENFVLNMPPHHAGLWSPESLQNLENFFPLRMEKLFFEALQAENCLWYYDVQIRRLRRFTQHLPILNKITNYLTVKFRPQGVELIKSFRHKIPGHSMLVVYTRVS